MKNQNNRNNRNGKSSLPQLLSGSEYKTDDSDLYRNMNLLGFAVAIVVYANEDDVSDDCKESWFKLFERECVKVVQNKKNLRDFYRCNNPSNRSPDIGNEDWYEKMVLAWLKNSLFNAPDWNGLYKLTKIQIIWLKKDPSAEWWKVVQTVCKRAKTTVDVLDPIEKILRITEEYNAENKEIKSNNEQAKKAEGNKIMKTTVTNKEIWEAIKNEYGIRKRDFGKKINFVSDNFKRKIIFRDIEHAFVLASQDFSKPAVILAGGVIEELLKLYLKHKNIKPKGNRFVNYIQACDEERLLKHGVSRQTDSIRDFRNLVHLDNEKSKRYTVSKATAKGAVSSIFTIANDFH